MSAKFIASVLGFAVIFFSGFAHSTTLIFDASGNIVGSVAGTWGGAGVQNPSVSKVGAAVGQGITQTLVNRGFSASDPRVTSTVKSVATRVASTVAVAGAGSSWLTILSRANTVAVAGVLIYQGLSWYFDAKTGQVTTQPPGTLATPIFSNGVQTGQMAWTLGSAWFGSPEEAFSYSVEGPTLKNYADAQFLNVAVTKNATSATISYTLKVPSASINTPYTKTVTGQIWSIASACSPGFGYLSGTGCVSAGLDKSHWANSPIQTYTPQQAYDQLSQAAKDSQISKELMTELTNRVWKDAASQPDFQGVPWSANNPTKPDTFTPYITQEPQAWPNTKEIASPVSTATPPVAQPLADNTAISNPTSSTATKVDLGPDPGVPPPTLEDPPTDLFKPIKDVMEPWLSWQVPNHSTVCPTWHAAPSVAGHVFDLDLSFHCTFIEKYRNAIATAAIVCWVVGAVFIVLSA